MASATPNPLLTPFTLPDGTELSMRIVYAPLTRDRAVGTIPQPNAATYYSQRAHKGGLMLTEGTCISPEAHGYPDTPGIYTEAQIAAWKPVIKAVHDKGARFYCQLWHVGRASHQEYQPDGAAPMAPSAIPIISEEIKVYISTGPADYPTPRAMTAEEIKKVVEQFRVAARNAIDAGFDGVEVHGANGYLLEQFIKDGINKREDEFGGSLENRLRFPLQVIKAVADEVGASKVGVRLSPYSSFLDASDSDPVGTYLGLVEALNSLGLAYVHFIEARAQGNADLEDVKETLEPFRKAFKGPFIAAGGYKRENGMEAIENGSADLITYGRLFLANPDLPRRFELNAPLNPYDRSTFFSGDQVKGYIDYPFLDEEPKKAE
ncbi:unnamed protein product [Closterium sp. NIES-64]|nr:unnamed protein product [Closterium sp. NIES-65]CAI5990955.1 unnamed protein product [Closterium sp. NIES-64]